MLAPVRHGAAVRIERVLEEADHQHALVAGEDVLGAVAVVHVEVDDRHPLRPCRPARGARRSATLLKKQKPIAWSRRRVVAGRAHRAEGVLELAGDHRVGGGHRRAGGAQRRAQVCAFRRRCRGRAARTAGRRPRSRSASSRSSRMAATCCAYGPARCRREAERRLAVLERGVEAGGQQVVLDRVEPLRALGVARAHVVRAAIGVREITRFWSSV